MVETLSMPGLQQERELTIERLTPDQRMNFSANLLQSPIKEGEPGADKIYIMAKVRKEGNLYVLEVADDTPTVALNDNVKQQFELRNSPTVTEIRNKIFPELGDYSLISGGSFVWIIDKGIPKMITIKRDEQAPTDAGCLTGPAGRCGELPSETSVNETNEELIIVTVGGTYKLLGFYRNLDQINKVIHKKLHQIESVYNRLQSTNPTTARNLLRIQGPDDIQMLNLTEFAAQSGNHNQVITTIGGRAVDSIENGSVFFDQKANTYELRETIRIALPEGIEICEILDGEPYGRDIVLGTPDEIKSLPMVSTLQDYIQKIG